MSDKIVYVLPKRGQLTLKQRIMLIMYILRGYKIQFLNNDNSICRGYRANIVIEDYLDFDFINTDEILK